MDNLPQELIVDILSRVPAKTVGRCRCVSKPWKSLLYQPQFLKTHLNKTQHPNNYTQQSLILVSNNRRSLTCANFSNANHLFATNLTFADHLFWDDRIDGICFCNGLMLVAVSRHKFILINPATKEVKQLPTYAIDHYRYFYSYSDPSFGIGYDSVSDDYKVVVVLFDFRGVLETIVNVYSVRNGTWKRVETPLKISRRYNNDAGKYIAGCIHWVKTCTLDGSSVILAFDLHEEKFVEVSGMYGVKDSWTKFSIVAPDQDLEGYRLVCFMENDLVLLEECLINFKNLVMCNLKDKTFQKVVVKQDFVIFCSIEGTFIESLVSPHTGTLCA